MSEKLRAVFHACVPRPIASAIRNLRQTLHLYKDSVLQAHRYNRNYSRVASTELTQLETRIMFLSHQIEKGLSHSDFRYGFGRKVFLELPAMLKSLELADSNYEENTVFQESMSALHEYMERHIRAGKDISWQKSLFTNEQWNRIKSANPSRGGSIVIRRSTKANNSLLPYAQLNEHRHSVREFSDEPVDVNLIEQAIDMAMRTPSVCNRQPTRVHLILNHEIITKALAIQGGVRGYAAPPALILITSDLRSFITSYERNEGFTDGGLFGMSLLLSLESLGLASCPLNTMFTAKADKDTRKLLDLPDNEVPVMYIEVGNFLEETRTCASVRYTGNQITTVIK
ncbi:nitroreductase family protein [Bifidobacterium pseudocatenulatum]|uniref:nitroreductase family protein n=1 Tax=Bifidobacterium TaxID=1678 RepID=UPI0028410CEC|nr:nitroreductase family protein [Bifidobacterium sp.]MDR3859047.1 nitroreductase family protein [Bifidobacterium sp.]